MCDLFSWVELNEASQKKHLGSKVLFMTDETVKVLRGRAAGRLWGDDDVVGHSAIEAYYQDCHGTHQESRDKIPPVMAEMVNAGKLNGMIQGILGKDRKAWPKYRKDGTRVVYNPSLNNCEENEEWVLKSIVYFCRNYTINKKDLEGERQNAIKTYLEGRRGSVANSLYWSDTSFPEFWSDLYYLSMGKRFDYCSPGKLKPWTNAEKKKIFKLPKVKR
jgi:hypothetical protein